MNKTKELKKQFIFDWQPSDQQKSTQNQNFQFELNRLLNEVSNWQTCPLCNGTGIKSTPGLSTGCPPCEVCNGKRIISLKTGKPPKTGE